MKITAEHVNELKAIITPWDTEEMREQYRKGDFHRAEEVKDVDKRYRWDLFWASKAWRDFDHPEYDNAHIDTALRSIVPIL